ncbi:hypothetical protein TTHERM_000310189 (macronuclear) [Tetrahymena thermophila SB210]|uniref:Uncharacterized protein n=1 Tax=Tetrahymena thermophila (strain SB210) TaxID=312017 RepID=W7X1M9_TETTS|nr:hypothetical protein TTHERM_000310189 [Tetrahymena thermophila SB210]EWS73150.1 hypothetical protein TTHERM_000310189 [Tetrahymena thermophila SB210]|eukprot:XP_012654337.1 hypothetical protein TTHERM_000310189 [Tetrahymena thermophila SB210]
MNHKFKSALTMLSQIYVQGDLKLVINMILLFQIYQIKYQLLILNINYLNTEEIAKKDNYPISQKLMQWFLLYVKISRTLCLILSNQISDLQIIIGKALQS